MAREQPINAEVPAADSPATAEGSAKAAVKDPPKAPEPPGAASAADDPAAAEADRRRRRHRRRLHRRRDPRRRPWRQRRARRGAGGQRRRGCGGRGCAGPCGDLGTRVSGLRDQEHDPGRRLRPGGERGRRGPRRLPLDRRGPAAGRRHPRRRIRLARRDRGRGADGAAVAGADPVLRAKAGCRTSAPKRSPPSTRRAARRPTADAVFAIGDAPAPDGRATKSISAKGPAALAAAIARLRDRLVGAPPKHDRDRPARPAGLRDAGRGLGRPLRRPGPLRLRPGAAEGDRLGPAANTPRPPSTSSGRPRRSPPASSAKSRPSTGTCDGSPARTRSATRSPSPATTTAISAGTSTTRATASSSPAARTPLDAAAAAPLSASGTWGPLLLTDDADTLPGALRGYLLDVKPGYTDRPDARLLQPRLGDRRPGGDRSGTTG